MNGSEEWHRLDRCVRKLDRNKWNAYDVALMIRCGLLTPDEMVALLQTQHGPRVWRQLRRIYQFCPPKDVFVPGQLIVNSWRPTIPHDPLHLTLAYSAGAPFHCRFGHVHTLARKLPLLCRAADFGSAYQRLLAFERVQWHIRCTVLLSGMKRLRKSPVLFKMDRYVVSMIVKDIWNLQFQSREAFARHKEIGSWWDNAFTAVFVVFVVCGCALSIWVHWFWSK